MKNLKIPIVFKLVVMIVFILIIATGFIAYRSSQVFEEISSKRERDTTQEGASSRADQVSTLLEKYIDKTRIAAYAILKSKDQMSANDLESSFYQDRDLVNLALYSWQDGQPVMIHEVKKSAFFIERGLPSSYIEQVRVAKPIALNKIFAGSIEILNSSTPQGALILTLGLPLSKSESGQITHVAVADIRLDGLQNIFASESALSYFLVDRDGVVISHPDESLIFSGKNLSGLGIIELAKKSKSRSQEKKYFDAATNTNYMASFAQTRFGPIVIAQAPESIILENAQIVRHAAYYITGIVISVALFIIFLFSLTLTGPIEKLVMVTRAVALGNYNVTTNVSTRDEVGELAESVDKMVGGLREREKMRTVLNKFHGSKVTEDLLKGEIGLGGSKKHVTVFFSDIRDFTQFSEGHAPEEVVAMLNEYFEIMVGIVVRNHGVVDKFIGDAMMAIWGVPQTTETDEWYAVNAALEMRQALEALNKSREGRGLAPIRMGMGINTGEAIAGTMGSTERMEYTVIGDTVNTASRIESASKSLGVDILISESTAQKIEKHFVLEIAGSVQAKGKSEPLKLFKVKGSIDQNGDQTLIDSVYANFKPRDDEKVRAS